MSIGKVVKGSLWLYFSSIINNFIGYLYWIIATKFTESSIIGTTAAIVGFSSLIAIYFNLSLSSGEIRMIGKSLGLNDYERINYYFSNSLIISFFLSLIASILLFFLPDGFMGYSRIELSFASLFILIGYCSWSAIFSSFFIALLKTEIIALITLISQISKFIIGIFLLYIGMGLYGIIGGLIISILISDIIYIIMCKRIEWLKIKKLNKKIIKELIIASLPSYISAILGSTGSWLGIISIYGIIGGKTTGTYYISFMIASFVYTISSTILGLMFPLLSGMEDGRKRAISRAIRISYAITMPITALGILYPHVPLGFLGKEYLNSTLSLQILLIGTFIMPITSGFANLIYAYGKYKLVTLFGIASNIPRIILYIPMVNYFGDLGAAISYISGYFSELIVTIIMSKKIGFRLEFKPILVLTPLLIAILANLFSLHWIISTILVFIISIFVYARLNLIKKEDLKDIYEAIFSKRYFLSYARFIVHILYGE
ncbi:MAG: oligosaccharide flippase family protein [Candidatus Methanomethylicaceae archaeon]